MKKNFNLLIAACFLINTVQAQVNCPSGLMGVSSPNVGIGTTTTTSAFGVHLFGGLGRSIPQGLYIERSDTPATNQDCALSIHFSSNGFTSASIGGGSCNFMLHPSINTPSPDMAFSTNTVKPQLIIKNSGRVGIGTINPSDKLEINSGSNGRSGLRFTKLNALTSTSATPGDFNCNKVLTVDNNGEVILIDLTTCTSSSKMANTDEQVSDLQSQIEILQAQVQELQTLIHQISSVELKSTIKPISQLEVFPNPSADHISVSYKTGNVSTENKLVLTNMMGETLKEVKLFHADDVVDISISDLTSGNYILVLFSDGVPVKNTKVNVVK